jgi:hypothetical protein
LIFFSDLARCQLQRWRNRPVKLTETEVVEAGLFKVNDDFGNLLQMLFYESAPQAAPLTASESREVMPAPEFQSKVIRPDRRPAL